MIFDELIRPQSFNILAMCCIFLILPDSEWPDCAKLWLKLINSLLSAGSNHKIPTNNICVVKKRKLKLQVLLYDLQAVLALATPFWPTVAGRGAVTSLPKGQQIFGYIRWYFMKIAQCFHLFFFFPYCWKMGKSTLCHKMAAKVLWPSHNNFKTSSGSPWHFCFGFLIWF